MAVASVAKNNSEQGIKHIIMRNFFSIISFVFINACSAQHNKIPVMEKFNIAEYNSKKTSDGLYRATLKDGTMVIQFAAADIYIEKLSPPGDLFYEYKEFYSNGNLK